MKNSRWVNYLLTKSQYVIHLNWVTVAAAITDMILCKEEESFCHISLILMPTVAYIIIAIIVWLWALNHLSKIKGDNDINIDIK